MGLRGLHTGGWWPAGSGACRPRCPDLGRAAHHKGAFVARVYKTSQIFSLSLYEVLALPVQAGKNKASYNLLR